MTPAESDELSEQIKRLHGDAALHLSRAVALVTCAYPHRGLIDDTDNISRAMSNAQAAVDSLKKLVVAARKWRGFALSEALADAGSAPYPERD